MNNLQDLKEAYDKAREENDRELMLNISLMMEIELSKMFGGIR